MSDVRLGEMIDDSTTQRMVVPWGVVESVGSKSCKFKKYIVLGRISSFGFICKKKYMMSNKIILAIILLIFSKKIFAQTDSVNYVVKQDDPRKVQTLQISLVPFYMGWGTLSSTLGWTIEARCDIGKKYSAMLAFRQSYLNLDEVDYADNFENSKSTRLSKFEAAVCFNLSEKIKERKFSFALSSQTIMAGPTKLYLTKDKEVTGHELKIRSIKFNIIDLHNPLNLYIVSQDRRIFGLSTTNNYDTLNFIKDSIRGGTSLSNINGFINSIILSGGICRKKIVNMTVDFDKYGTRKGKSAKWMYLDCLFSPFAKFSDVTLKDGTRYKIHCDPRQFIGWRLGFLTVNPAPSNLVGLYYKLELGTLPGFKLYNINFFLDVSIGFTIGSNPKFLNR